MNRSRISAAAALAALAGLTIAAPAYAQDDTRPVRTVTTVAPQAPSAREDATRTMPTYDAWGSSDTDSTSETMYRLTRDFAVTSELGVRRLGSVPLWPRGDMKFGDFRIAPYIREGVEYVSNFYRVNKTGTFGSPNANDASITHTNEIGALADAKFAGGRLRLAMSVAAVWNVRYDDGNDDRGVTPGGIPIDAKKPDTFEFDGQIAASYRWPSGAYVKAGVAYERRSDPIDVEPTAEFQRTNQRFFVTAGLDKDILFGSKFRFEFGMAARDAIGRDPALSDLDRTETSYYVKASYPFWRDTTRIFARARYRQDERESDRINDGGTWGMDVGMEGTIPISKGEYRGLTGQVSVGFDAALYENETFGSGVGRTIRDDNRRNNSLSFNALLQYLFSRRSSIDLRFLRTNQFSFHGNYQIVDRLDLAFQHAFGQRLIGRTAVFAEHTDPSGLLRQETVVGGRTTGQYPSTTRFGAGVGFRYKITDWADLDGQYDWERRNNRITGFVNHRATLGVTFYLNALKPRSRQSAESALASDFARPVSATGAMAPRTTGAASAVDPAATAPSAPAAKAPSAPVAKAPEPARPRAPEPSAPSSDRADVRTSGAATFEAGPGGGQAGGMLRLRDADARATIEFGDGSTVHVVGPAIVRIVSLTATGNRIQLASGRIADARILGVPLEIQTGVDASLVLQNARATAQADRGGTVTFQSLGGEYARVHSAGRTHDLRQEPWSFTGTK